MSFKIKFLGFLWLAFLFVLAAEAQQGTIRIPLKTFTKQASDLVGANGETLSFSELSALHQKGSDLSNLNPLENKYWQNKKYAAVDSNLHQRMPLEAGKLIIDSYLGGNRDLGFFSVIVRPVDKPSERYVLTLGLQVHASLLKSALLRKLGYFQESPKHYSKVQLSFDTKEKKTEFIETAFCEKGPSEIAVDCLSIDPFKSKEIKREFLSHIDEKNLYVHGVYLEKMNPEVPSLFDGLTPASSDLVSYFSQSRAYRALAIPFVIGDFSESLNRVSTHIALLRNGYVFLNYPFSGDFAETSADDAKWILKRMAQFSDADWTDIVNTSKYPLSLRPLVKAKLILRFKNMFTTFFSANELGNYKLTATPQLKYTSVDGLVVNGKVTTEYIAGYPQRFSHGERQSPFETGDLIQYMNVKAQSSALGAAVDLLNQQLTKSKILTQQLDGVIITENGFKPVGSAVGRQFGLNFSAQRMVTTGTFYGSQAAVQLVDNVTISAGLGIFKIINDVYGYSQNLGGQVSYNRDFTHVRPLASIKETKAIPWKEVLVPSHLKKIASPLKDGKLSEFVSTLKTGEVFTITESVGVAGQMGYDAGLDALIGFSGVTVPTFSVSVGTQKVILRQTQIIRTDLGFQIYIRNQNSKALSLTFDFNYFINLLKIKNETTLTDLHTDAFILQFNSDFIQQVESGDLKVEEGSPEKKNYDEQKEFTQKLSGALRGLIFQSSTDQLYSSFRRQQFTIDHNIKTNEMTAKILWYRSAQLNEEHYLKIKKSDLVNPDHEDVVDNKPIEIVTYKKGELIGKDYLGFGLNVLDGLIKEKVKGDFVPRLSQDSKNPSQIPFGQAQWHTIRTDTELSQDRVGALPSVSVIQTVWSGWSLKKTDLDRIIKITQDKLKGTEYESVDIIPEGTFNNIKKVDFFRITENLSLLPSALEKIKSFVVYPDVKDAEKDKVIFLGRFFQKMSEMGKDNKFRAQDQAVYNNIILLMGNGDLKKGQQAYLARCNANKTQMYNYKWLKGSNYECLEPWIENIIRLSRDFSSGNLRQQNKWMTELIYELEKNIPVSVLLNAIGKENYLFFLEVTGFRTGDEDADQSVYVSNIVGEPADKHPYSNGLLNIIAEKSMISPLELDRTQGSFQ